jgi:dihydrofolate synthase / folylpolyglutamate synthase
MRARIGKSYEEALRFMGTFLNYDKASSYEEFETVAQDIAEFRAALRDFGDPHLKYSVVHVAGSKAKGSTCAFLASVLRTAGQRTGLLISPHLVEHTERVTVDGVEITREDYGRLTARVRARLSDGRDPLHPRFRKRLKQWLGLRPPPPIKRHFRNLHAYHDGVGFLHFANQKVDFAVIETGMGGRLDHTNVFDRPPDKPDGILLSVITAMAFEHKIPLGATMQQISEHKAGIIRRHGLTVLGPQRQEWYAGICKQIEARREAVGAPPVLDTNTTILLEPGSGRFSPEGCEAEYRCDRKRLAQWLEAVGAPDAGAAGELVEALSRGLTLRSPLAGRHQADNLRTVIASAIALGVRGTPITVEQLRDGIASTVWPARFEILSREPLIIADCCHEPLSIETFSRTYREFYGDRPVIAMIGFLRDNDIPTMCRAMVPHLPLKHIVLCKPNLPVRAMDPKAAVPIVEPILNVPITVIESPSEALLHAYKMRSGEESLIVMTDFYIAGMARTIVREWLTKGPPAEAIGS